MYPCLIKLHNWKDGDLRNKTVNEGTEQFVWTEFLFHKNFSKKGLCKSIGNSSLQKDLESIYFMNCVSLIIWQGGHLYLKNLKELECTEIEFLHWNLYLMKLFLGVFQDSTGIFFKSQTFYLKLLDIVCQDFISKSEYNVEW